MPTAASISLDFAIIGAMKCGTTSLFDFLAAHPDVCAPANKEPHYFTRGYRLPAAYYRRLFRGCGPGQRRGEASPTYSWVDRFPECPARIARDAPDVATAVANPEIWERSSYRTTIEAYLAHFPRTQLHVADLATLDSPTRLGDVLAFLDLDPAPLEPLALPTANVSDERTAVPGVVGRIASSAYGAMIRDLVPRERLRRIKRRVERPVDPGRMPAITIDDLRHHEPERCAAVEEQFAWVRAEFLSD